MNYPILIGEWEVLVQLVNDMNKKTIVILSTYITSVRKEEVLINVINQIRKTGFDIMVISHKSIRQEIIDLCDFFVCDKDNRLLPIHVTPITWHHDYLHKINKLISVHGYVIMKNISTSLTLSNLYKYENFIYTEYDMDFHDDDLDKLKNIFIDLDLHKKDFFISKPEHDKYESLFFAGKIKPFIEKFTLISNYEDWFTTPPYANSNHSLEELFYIMGREFEDSMIKISSVEDYFSKSKINIFSITEASGYPVVYNRTRPKYPVFFIISKGRHYRLILNEEEVVNRYFSPNEWFKYQLDLDKNNEIDLEFYSDGQLVFKRLLNSETIDLDKEYSFLEEVS